MKKIDNLPTILVKEIVHDGSHSIIIGSVDHWESVGEGHLVYMLLGEENIVEGEFQDVNEISRLVKFVTKGLVSNILRIGQKYSFFDGYWGQRAALVFDRSLLWEKINFKPRDAIKHKDDGSKELVKDGWDHEHCFICWATIDLYQNTAYMKSNEDDIVCIECFEKYILRKSVDFIVD